MVAAQNLRATHDVDNRVKGVDAKVASVGGEVKEVNDKVAVPIDGMQTHSSRPPKPSNPNSLDVREARVITQQTVDDADQVKRSWFSNCFYMGIAGSSSVTGCQLRQDIRRWLSPPDPSTNNNIASSASHKGTAEWFF